MAQHKLSLDIPDVLNTCIMKIIDTSHYSELVGVKCPQLQIQSPGFTSSYFVDNVEPDFSLNLSACDLKIQTKKCGTDFNDLHDMIYVIRWSLSPNNTVFVEYNHLRITKALNILKKQYCALDMGDCEPSPELQKKLNQLTEIQQYLSAAKAKVEVCGEANKGLQLYKYAMSKLDKLKCKTC